MRALGAQIRSTREAASLTQADLGSRAGIVGKYVSEIELGKRDVPVSTLHAIIEDGLGLRLAIELHARNGSQPNLKLPPLPRPVEEVARLLAALPPDDRARVLALVRGIAALIGRG